MKYIYDNDNFKREFIMDPADKDKYCVACCVKDENDYLIEWCEHYKKLGFDKILLADNNDDDSLDILLKDYIDDGFVQIFDFRNTDLKSFQGNFNTMISNEGNYKWCAYFDADEFLELHIYKSIKNYLSVIPNDLYCVGFFWLLYGGNNQIDYVDKPLSDRFPEPCKPINYRLDNGHTKCILKGGIKGFRMGCHYPNEWPDINKIIFIGKNAIPYNNFYRLHYPVIYEDGYLKHYYTKSYAEFIAKINRGWPDAGCKNNSIYKTKGYLYYNNDNFNVSKFANSTTLSLTTYKKDENLVEYLRNNLFNVNEDKLMYIKYNPYCNILMTVYSIMNYIIAAKDLGFTFMIQRNGVIDNNLYNMLFECALENNVKIVILSDGDMNNSPIINFEIKNLSDNSGIYRIINV